MSGGLYIVERAGCFAVFGPDGKRLSEWFDGKSAATTSLRNRSQVIERSRRTRRRSCICCGTGFRSEGAHHRMCTGCRQRSTNPFEDPVRDYL